VADHDAFPVGTLVEVVDIPRLKGMHLSVLSGSTVGGLRLSTKTNRLLVPVTLGDGQIFHLHEENLIARSSLLSSGEGGGKTLMGALLPLPLLSLALFRAVDAVYFSPALNQRFGSPDLLVLYCNALASFCCMLGAWRPRVALAAAFILFAVVKQAADGGVAVAPLVGVSREDRASGGVRTTVFITGGNSGIGRAVASELLRQGHRVLLGCRSTTRCAAAADALAVERSGEDRGGGLVLPVGGMDLRRLGSLDEFSGAIKRTLLNHSTSNGVIDEPYFSLLVFNAGYLPLGNGTVSTTPMSHFEEGLFEMYTGHHSLLHSLRDANLLAPPDRVNLVTVSSDAMRFGSFHASLGAEWDERGTLVNSVPDLSGQDTRGCALPSLGLVPGGFGTPLCIPRRAKGAVPGVRSLLVPTGWTFGAYARAKLANVLFAREAQRRGFVARSTAVMPGIVCTNIVRVPVWWAPINRIICPLFLRPVSVAARVVLRAAMLPTMATGEGPAFEGFYFFNGRGEALGPESLQFRSVAWMDRAARRLWDIASEQQIQSFV
jgi:NAD(P)-dependent dehydrogenase (short-subunit alcohol dehydrogenase family)